MFLALSSLMELSIFMEIILSCSSSSCLLLLMSESLLSVSRVSANFCPPVVFLARCEGSKACLRVAAMLGFSVFLLGVCAKVMIGLGVCAKSVEGS